MRQRSCRSYLIIGLGTCLLLAIACSALAVLDGVQVRRYWSSHGLEYGRDSLDAFVMGQVRPGMSRDQVHKKMVQLGRVDFSDGGDIAGQTTEYADLWTGLISRSTYVFFYDSQDKLVRVMVIS
jgi:hypothetical protein